MRGRLLALLAAPQPAQFDAPPALPLTVSTPDLRLHLAGGQHAQRDGCHLICDAGTVIPVEEVLAAYLSRPDDWRPDLPGPYSLVLLDPGRRRCLLARDHGGQRALYYRAAAGQMTVASRLPDLLRAAGGRLPLHVPALLDSLVTGYPVPPETLYQGLRQVRAGHLLRWDAGAYSETPLPLPSAPEAPLRALIEQALPTAGQSAAVLLSGGLD
ncbi:MAG: hypothetical protein HUU35_13580, partial [Armatimonadetes bacterium]|nr:hypothetical protein [Armatimonadota bacterium]